MEHYALVYFPYKRLAKIDEFREKYDPQWHIIQPHITLVSPFSPVSQAQVINQLATTTHELKSFQIHLQGLLKTDDNHLFLIVKEGKEKLIKIHAALFSVLLSTQNKNPFFVPHITLGVFQTKDNQFDITLYRKAKTEAERMHLDIYDTFDNISLIKGDGITPAKIIKTFPIP